MDNKRRSNYYPIYDYLRIVLALMIIAIHTGLFPKVLFPWLRSAVPLFFLLSSYLLFSRLHEAQAEEKRSILWQYIKRNLCFYLFWFAALAPITFYCKDYFDDGIIKGILTLIQHALFSSTFFSSWFLAALIIGTIIVYYAAAVVNWKGLLAVSLVIFALICFRSSYWQFVPKDSFLVSLDNAYVRIFTEPFKSFPAAILWIVIGKLFAEKKIKFNQLQSYLTLALGIALLYAEWRIVKQTTGETRNDCYFMLLPFCIGAFSAVKLYESKSFAHDTQALRKASAITYASHASIATLISAITNTLFRVNVYNHALSLFAITTFLSLLLSAALLLLSRRRFLSFLKYSY